MSVSACLCVCVSVSPCLLDSVSLGLGPTIKARDLKTNGDFLPCRRPYGLHGPRMRQKRTGALRELPIDSVLMFRRDGTGEVEVPGTPEAFPKTSRRCLEASLLRAASPEYMSLTEYVGNRGHLSVSLVEDPMLLLVLFF